MFGPLSAYTSPLILLHRLFKLKLYIGNNAIYSQSFDFVTLALIGLDKRLRRFICKLAIFVRRLSNVLAKLSLLSTVFIDRSSSMDNTPSDSESGDIGRSQKELSWLWKRS